MRSFVPVGLILLGLYGAGPALAQDEAEDDNARDGFYVGANVGYQRIDADFDVATISLLGGIREGRYAADLEVSFQPESSETDGVKASGISAFVNARVYLYEKWAIQPYGLIGAGLQSVYFRAPGPAEDSNEIAAALRAGGGLEVLLLDMLSLDATALYGRGFGNIESDSVTVTAGARLYF